MEGHRGSNKVDGQKNVQSNKGFVTQTFFRATDHIYVIL